MDAGAHHRADRLLVHSLVLPARRSRAKTLGLHPSLAAIARPFATGFSSHDGTDIAFTTIRRPRPLTPSSALQNNATKLTAELNTTEKAKRGPFDPFAIMQVRAAFWLAATSVALICWPTATVARNFTLRDEITGRKFLDDFYFWAYNDPTNGTVEYVDEFTAVAKRLAYVDPSGRFVMRADNTTVVAADRGRPSVRIHSKRKVADGIIVGKFTHMPQGCATWPAFWTCTTERWPAGGEIDIVEGANDQGPRNLASLHTLYGCHIPGGSRSDQSGFTSQTDCSYQPGCSASFTADRSYGPGFNANGGGYFALRRETRPGDPGIGVYFWPITTPASSLPAAVAAVADGASAPKYVVTNANATGNDRSELNKWGNPAAFFANTANATASPAVLAGAPGSVCQMENYFDEHEIIINLSLCGDWAGETFGYSGCSARYDNVSCETFVRNNPAAFTDARWEIDYLRIYDNAASSNFSPAQAFGFALAALLSLALLL